MRVERCEVCGFVWDEVTVPDVHARLPEISEHWASTLTSAKQAAVRARPTPERWSGLEYAAHVRDVLFNLRDRIIVGLAESEPSPPSMYPAFRVDAGLYADDDPDVIAAEIRTASALFVRTIARLTEPQLARTLRYPWPREAARSLGWVCAQALHECDHHLDDLRENLRSDRIKEDLR